jgi:crotonyl-CoA reductase
VTCGSSTGYGRRFDNRYLWMNLKRVIGSHAANL